VRCINALADRLLTLCAHDLLQQVGVYGRCWAVDSLDTPVAVNVRARLQVALERSIQLSRKTTAAMPRAVVLPGGGPGGANSAAPASGVGAGGHAAAAAASAAGAGGVVGIGAAAADAGGGASRPASFLPGSATVSDVSSALASGIVPCCAAGASASPDEPPCSHRWLATLRGVSAPPGSFAHATSALAAVWHVLLVTGLCTWSELCHSHGTIHGDTHGGSRPLVTCVR
jgi:hypothetical protein